MNRSAQIAGCVALLAVLVGGIVFSFAGQNAGLVPSRADLTAWVHGLGPWGGLGIIALMALHSLVAFPAEIVAFIAGQLFGLVWGTIYVWIGAMIGAALAFGLARMFGRAFVVGLLPVSAQARLEQWSATDSALTLLTARLIPIIAFNLINYAAGLTKVGWWTFLWTTGIGILPLTILFVYLGERMREASWGDWGLLGVAALVLWAAVVVVQRVVRRGGGAQEPPA